MTSGERGDGFDMLAWGRLVVLRRQVVFVAFPRRQLIHTQLHANQCSLTSASEVQILYAERTSIPVDAFLTVGFGGLRDEQREAARADSGTCPLGLRIFRLLVMESVAWSPLRHLASTISFSFRASRSESGTSS